jgi:hypothetical protein
LKSFLPSFLGQTSALPLHWVTSHTKEFLLSSVASRSTAYYQEKDGYRERERESIFFWKMKGLSIKQDMKSALLTESNRTGHTMYSRTWRLWKEDARTLGVGRLGGRLGSEDGLEGRTSRKSCKTNLVLFKSQVRRKVKRYLDHPWTLKGFPTNQENRWVLSGKD